MDVLHVQEAKNCGGFGSLTDRLTRAPCCYQSIPKYGTDVGCQVAQMTDTHVGEERLWRSIKTRALFDWKRKLGTVRYLDKWVVDSLVGAFHL